MIQQRSHREQNKFKEMHICFATDVEIDLLKTGNVSVLKLCYSDLFVMTGHRSNLSFKRTYFVFDTLLRGNFFYFKQT